MRFYLIFITLIFVVAANGQQTNPVDRQVTNPITDTPSVNPLAQEQPTPTPPNKNKDNEFTQEGGDDEVVVYSNKQTASIIQGTTSSDGKRKCPGEHQHGHL